MSENSPTFQVGGMSDPEAAAHTPSRLESSKTRGIVEVGRKHAYYANERGERFNLVALQRMNLQYLRKRLLDEAVDIFTQGDLDDENSSKITELMHDYCTAVKDRDYMRDCAQRDWNGNPFHLKSERPLERELLDSLKARGVGPIPMSLPDDPNKGPELPCGPWDSVSSDRMRVERYALAVTGVVILTVPMIIMVLVGNTHASLAVVSVFTIVFAVGLSYFSPTKLPIELLSATAAYAAVLVVFVGGTTNQG